MRVQGQGQVRSMRLDLDQLEDSFDGIQRLMEFLGIEEAKQRTPL
jgi:hypothetical protein